MKDAWTADVLPWCCPGAALKVIRLHAMVIDSLP
jgi:hypothetical protein